MADDELDPAPVPAGGESRSVALTDRMRRDLKVAMRARDQVRVRALRTAMGAIANAEAPSIDTDPRTTSDEPDVGRLVEHRRLELTDDDLHRILRAEIADRHDTAEQFDAHDRADEAAVVRAEAAVIEAYLG
jgi:uncharacterized protein YqeY